MPMRMRMNKATILQVIIKSFMIATGLTNESDAKELGK
jgi:hypothetical protein